MKFTGGQNCSENPGGDPCFSKAATAAQELLEAGTAINVYYTPENPSISCILRSENVSPAGIIGIVFGILIIGFGVFLVIVMFVKIVSKLNSG